MKNNDNYYLIVPSGGVGKRMKTKTPKQYLHLDNKLTVLDQTLKTLLEIKKIKGFVVAIADNDTQFQHSNFRHHPKLLTTASAGAQRFNSVMSALKALRGVAQNNDWILVHDAVRPCITKNEVMNLIKQLENDKIGGLLAIPMTDTIKKVQHNKVQMTLDRDNLWQATTPQMYRFSVLFKALENAISDNINITDEASAIEYLGLQSGVVVGSKTNLKISLAEDLALANFYLKNK